MRAVLAVLCVALALPARSDGPPLPPPGQGHYIVAPGASIRLSDGRVITAVPDKSDPAFGGVYAPAEWARFDLEVRRYYEVYAKECVEKAKDERMDGVVIGTIAGVTISAAIFGVIALVR